MISEINQRITQLNNGEVPSGYKKTSVGIVPNEWTEHTLGDIFIFKNGLNKEKGAFGQGTPIVNYTDVWKKRGLRAKDINGRVALSEKEIQTYEAKAGDVFFTRTSETIDEIGYSSVLLEDVENAVFSGFVLRARPYNDLVHREYNQYCYSEPLMRQEIIKRSSMTTRALTSGPMLSQVAINLPSQREQSKIAEILMKWDEAIELETQCINSYLKIKKFLLQKLYIYNEKKYSLVRLGDAVISMSSGGTPLTSNSDYFDGDIVWVSIDDISKCEKYISDSARKLTAEGIDKSSAKIFPAGTILYAMYASIGKCAIAGVECSTSQAILGIAPDPTILDTQYLYYYLCSIQGNIILQGQKGTQSNLNKNMVSKFQIPIPINENGVDLEKQKHIASILINADDVISIHKSKLSELKKQCKALQQYLLNGIVRV